VRLERLTCLRKRRQRVNAYILSLSSTIWKRDELGEKGLGFSLGDNWGVAPSVEGGETGPAKGPPLDPESGKRENSWGGKTKLERESTSAEARCQNGQKVVEKYAGHCRVENPEEGTGSAKWVPEDRENMSGGGSWGQSMGNDHCTTEQEAKNPLEDGKEPAIGTHRGGPRHPQKGA